LKLRLSFLAIVFACFAALTVRADGIPADGRIIVGHGSDPAPPDNCGLTFKIHLNGNGGGIKNCTNTSGQDWIGLDIFATIDQDDTVNCITTSSPDADASEAAFGTCGTFLVDTFDHKKRIEIVLAGGEIANGSLFFLNLNGAGSSDPNAAGGWFAFEGGNLDAQAVTAPEPLTALLLACGLGILPFRRKFIALR